MLPTEQRLQLCTSPCEPDGATGLSLSWVIPVLASLLDGHIAGNGEWRAGRAPDAPASVEHARARAFGGDRVLDMSTQSFLGRFSRYAQVSPQVYVVAYVYLDRLCGRGVRVATTNVQRLLTTAVLVGSKFVEDTNYKNSDFAAVGGLSTAELKSLEIDFLFLMRFKLNVSEIVFRSYCRRLEREASVSHGTGHRKGKISIRISTASSFEFVSELLRQKTFEFSTVL